MKLSLTILFAIIFLSGCKSIFIEEDQASKDTINELSRQDSLLIIKALKDEDPEFLTKGEFPEPVGGMEAITEKIIYPAEAIEKGIEGRVLLAVRVTETGEIEKISVIKSIGGGCTLEAVKAVQETKFTPGKLNGKPVAALSIIPIDFRLPKL